MSTDRHGIHAVPESGHPKPILRFEQRPSLVRSISPGSSTSPVCFWLVLSYKHHTFERMLPEGFMGLSDDERDLMLAREGGELQRLLAPILVAEDAEVTP